MVSKPTHEELPPVAQQAKIMFEGVVAKHVALHPELAVKDKLETLAENSGAFKSSAHQIQVSEHGQVAAQAVGDASKGNSQGRH